MYIKKIELKLELDIFRDLLENKDEEYFKDLLEEVLGVKDGALLSLI